MIGIGHEFPVHWSIYYHNTNFHIDRIYIHISEKIRGKYAAGLFDPFGLYIPRVIGSNANVLASDGNPESADANDLVS